MAGIQEDLLELIQTLSVTEKRYFKVFATSNKSTDINYVALFDALCELDHYDEQTLVAKLRRKNKDNAAKDSGNRLNQEMQYLYRVLLQAMRQYNHQNFAYIQIQDMTSEAIFLRDRGLYKQAEKRIIKAKELAKKYYNTVALLELNRLERSLIWSLDVANEETLIASLIGESKRIVGVLEEEIAYEDLYAIVSNATNRKNQFVPGDEEIVELVSKIDALFSQKEPEKLSEFAKLRRYQISSHYKMAEKKIEDCSADIEQLLTWWDDNKHLKEQELFRYRISLTHIINFLFNSGELEKMIELHQRIRQSNSGTSNEKALMFRFFTMHEMLYYLNSRKIDAAKDMLAIIEEGIRIYPLSLKKKMAMIYNAAIVSFFAEDFPRCETWLLKIIAHSGSTIREDLIRKAFLLRIILLEAQEERREKAVRAAKKYFREHKQEERDSKAIKQGGNPENEILNLILKFMNAPPTNSEKKDAAQKLLDYLKELSSNPLSHRLSELDEFILWCQSKLKGQGVRITLEENSPE